MLAWNSIAPSRPTFTRCSLTQALSRRAASCWRGRFPGGRHPRSSRSRCRKARSPWQLTWVDPPSCGWAAEYAARTTDAGLAPPAQASCEAVQASSSSAGRALTIIGRRDAAQEGALATDRRARPAGRASGRPSRSTRGSRPRRPAAAAASAGRGAPGRQLISIALSKRAAAANTISASNVDSGRLRCAVFMRPVQWPRTSRFGFARAVTMRTRHRLAPASAARNGRCRRPRRAARAAPAPGRASRPR